MLRRLAHEQPDTFAFSPANLAWAEKQISKYPEGREASAIIPLLWRAQEQEGWLSRPAIEHVADMLGMAYIRALEVASFDFMFQLQPVGSVTNIQICGTLSCMISGAEDLVAICREKIAPTPHTVSADGKFSWEEVECLGACCNAPMAQIGKDYYEDLTVESLGDILDKLGRGKVPVPGPQNGRYASEPLAGLTSLKEHDSGRTKYNASVELATTLGETVKRIDGTEEPLRAPWGDRGGRNQAGESTTASPAAPAPGAIPSDPPSVSKASPALEKKAEAEQSAMIVDDDVAETVAGEETADTAAVGDDLKKINGIGPKLAELLAENGVTTIAQIAAWGPDEINWADNELARFKGRCTRDDWVGQAKALAKG